jgi:3',5'-cyclic AMP phosphodiesterase CpdA
VRWLEAELRRARADPTVDWIVAYFHHPLFSSGGGLGGHGSDLALRQSLQPLFDRYAVDLVFAGHDHDYERTFPIRCPEKQITTPACLVKSPDPKIVKQREGTVYIVTGAAGGPFAWRSVGVNWWTVFSRQIYQYVTVDVSDAGLDVKSVDAAGGVMDEARVERTLTPAAGPRGAAPPGPAKAPADSAGRKALIAPEGEVPVDSAAVADSSRARGARTVPPDAPPAAIPGAAPPAGNPR